jgi:hypothetical protein
MIVEVFVLSFLIGVGRHLLVAVEEALEELYEE